MTEKRYILFTAASNGTNEKTLPHNPRPRIEIQEKSPHPPLSPERERVKTKKEEKDLKRSSQKQIKRRAPFLIHASAQVHRTQESIGAHKQTHILA
jgi:hypothetical protein